MVTVDGQAVTGTVDGDGTWTADVVVTRQAPDSNGAQAAYAPDVAVDGAPVTAPPFRVTTKAAAKPTPTPTASAEPIPTASATSAPADPTATASATSASADPAAPTASAAASDPGLHRPENHEPQPAFHGGHDDGNIRLFAPSVRARDRDRKSVV